jgi:hypothetical protein
MELAQLLVDKGADASPVDEGVQTPLQTAVIWGFMEFAQLLIENGADPNIFDPYYGCPLQIALIHGRTDMAEILVRAGATEHVDEHGWTPTLCARESGHIKMLDLFPTACKEDSGLMDFHPPSSWSSKHKSHRLTLANGALDVIHNGGITKFLYH